MTTKPRMTSPISADVDTGEVNLEKDAERSKKTTEPVEEQSTEAEKMNPCNRQNRK